MQKAIIQTNIIKRQQGQHQTKNMRKNKNNQEQINKQNYKGLQNMVQIRKVHIRPGEHKAEIMTILQKFILK